VTFTPLVTGTFWFSISYDDGSGADNATIWQNFTVTVTAGGGGGDPGPPQLTASFTWNIKQGTGFVTFSDTSTGFNIIKWTWNFGDGTMSEKQNPTHTYKKVGSYSVTLEIRNSNGRVSTVTKTITIKEVQQGSIIPSSVATILPLVIIGIGLIGAIGGKTEAGRIASIVVILAGLLLFLLGYT